MKKISYLLAVMALILPLSGLMAKGKELPSKAINVNTASIEELTQLPGIGRSKAEAIVTYRQAHPFRAVSETRGARPYREFTVIPVDIFGNRFNGILDPFLLRRDEIDDRVARFYEILDGFCGKCHNSR